MCKSDLNKKTEIPLTFFILAGTFESKLRWFLRDDSNSAGNFELFNVFVLFWLFNKVVWMFGDKIRVTLRVRRGPTEWSAAIAALRSASLLGLLDRRPELVEAELAHQWVRLLLLLHGLRRRFLVARFLRDLRARRLYDGMTGKSAAGSILLWVSDDAGEFPFSNLISFNQLFLFSLNFYFYNECFVIYCCFFYFYYEHLFCLAKKYFLFTSRMSCCRRLTTFTTFIICLCKSVENVYLCFVGSFGFTSNCRRNKKNNICYLWIF